MAETLATYRTEMSKDDAASLDMIGEELTESLDRVNTNGARALAIVERMQGLGVVGGEPAPTDLNAALRTAVQTGCNTFQAEWDDFSVKPTFDLDSSLGQVPLVESDFAQAVVNLVSNACYSMRLKQNDLGDSYEPVLTASTRLADDVVEIRIRDNGAGIADDVVGRIFNPFFSTREGALGAGLGLPIAADVARRAGGDLLARHRVRGVRGIHDEPAAGCSCLRVGSTDPSRIIAGQAPAYPSPGPTRAFPKS